MKKITLLLISAMMALSFCGCGKQHTNSDKLQVYTSFYAMYDFAQQIGGDKADIHIMCPPGQEPHDYEPTARDIAGLTEADVFIYNGMGMEHWVDAVSDTLSSTDVIIVETSASAKHKTATNDPHIWLNPDNALAQLTAICDAFVKADNSNADYYNARLNDCKAKLSELTANYNAAVNTFSSTDIVVSHEAYLNMCDAFGLTQYAVNGIDNDDDPTPARMAEIEKFIKDNNIKYIFTEPLGTSSIMQTIANDTGCKILALDPFEGNSENKDYFAVMNENLEALKKALK